MRIPTSSPVLSAPGRNRSRRPAAAPPCRDRWVAAGTVGAVVGAAVGGALAAQARRGRGRQPDRGRSLPRENYAKPAALKDTRTSSTPRPTSTAGSQNAERWQEVRGTEKSLEPAGTRRRARQPRLINARQRSCLASRRKAIPGDATTTVDSLSRNPLTFTPGNPRACFSVPLRPIVFSTDAPPVIAY
jgi:hypothetical protein